MAHYAIIETGSKQYWVEPNQVIAVERLISATEKKIVLDKVLLARQDDRIEVGSPVIKGAQVICDYLGEFKDKKVISFKYRRRKDSRRKKGHRQVLSRLLVKEIKF